MKKEKLKILYEDKYLIAINKPSGLLTISDGFSYNNLYSEVSDYLKKKNKNNKVFIVHRLDKDTSGIILFAKNEYIKNCLQETWNDTKRLYYGIVHGNVLKEKDTIESYLHETKTLRVYSGNKNNGKLAITNYEVVNKINNKSLLKINIITGRKNQIRVHLHDINHPLLGDKKYGLKDNYKRLYLHAYYLSFTHPITKDNIIINTSYPKEFEKIIKN